MLHDDRLGTVLRLRSDGAASSRVQYRQLVDLLGTLPADAQGVQVDAAYDRLIALAQTIPPAERSAIISEHGLRLRAPRLVSFLAGEEPSVAAAAMTKADLAEEEWLDLVPALPVASRGYVRLRRDLSPRVLALLERLGIHDRGLPPVQRDTSILGEQAPSGSDGKVQVIGDIVRRIEEYRRSHPIGPERTAGGDAPRLPLDEGPGELGDLTVRRIDFTTDGSGRIDWAAGSVAAMVVGANLAAHAALDALIRHHQPLAGVLFELDGAAALAGRWQIDAEPVFSEIGGRFSGYRGRMRRPLELALVAQPATDPASDRMRQLLHELRTPVNAIQGFAEVIHQQLFGPAPHEYRALAATIAGDAARILAGFDELDRLARLSTGAMELTPGTCDFAEVVRDIALQLGNHAAQRQSGFALEIEPGELPVTLARIEAERMVWRLMASLTSSSMPGEVLYLKLNRHESSLELKLQLPSALRALDDDRLFHAAAGAGAAALSAGSFGTGFALRLAAVEAQAASGALERQADELRLTIPLTDPSDVNQVANQTA